MTTGNDNSKLAGALGLCLRAGQLKYGFDSAVKAVSEGKAFAAVVSEQAAERTRRNFAEACERNRTRLITLRLSPDEIDDAVGRRFAVAAVCDENFARLICDANGEDVIC